MDRTSLMDNEHERESMILKDELEKDYGVIRSAKDGLVKDEQIQWQRVAEIAKLKKQISLIEAIFRKMETAELPLKRKKCKELDREYYATTQRSL